MPVSKQSLTAERVRELLDYDPVTGALDWINPTRTSPCEGGKAGALGRAGSKYQFRRFVQIDYKRYPAHRLVWLHYHGTWPTQYVLPKNDDYDNLKIANLAETSSSESARRGGANRSNTSGYRGITWVEKRQRWFAYLTHHYKRVHVGYFRTMQEAIDARDLAVANIGALPVLDQTVRDERAASVTRDARLRVMWRKLQRQTSGLVGWPSFEAFAASISELPQANGKRLSLKPIRLDEVIGPENFEWVVQDSPWDYSTPEGKLAYSRAHREHNRSSYRDKELRKNFGISLDDYQGMLKEQHGVCAICKEPERRTRAGRLTLLAVDHCHTTEAIRGLLCSACNQAIGLCKDSPEVLRSAADYLERHAAKSNGVASSSARIEERRTRCPQT